MSNTSNATNSLELLTVRKNPLPEDDGNFTYKETSLKETVRSVQEARERQQLLIDRINEPQHLEAISRILTKGGISENEVAELAKKVLDEISNNMQSSMKSFQETEIIQLGHKLNRA